jgi:hypothetical protein
MASDTIFVASRLTVGGERLPDYCLSNLTATYRPLAGHRRGASLYNAFDKEISHPVGVEFRQTALRQDGRTAAIAGRRVKVLKRRVDPGPWALGPRRPQVEGLTGLQEFPGSAIWQNAGN